ncbi:hypothetical protein LCGC14_2627590, partial [marine sediment metagenome]
MAITSVLEVEYELVKLRRPTRYTPSLVGTALGEFARKAPKIITGFGIRPVVRKKKK